MSQQGTQVKKEKKGGNRKGKKEQELEEEKELGELEVEVKWGVEGGEM